MQAVFCYWIPSNLISLLQSIGALARLYASRPFLPHYRRSTNGAVTRARQARTELCRHCRTVHILTKDIDVYTWPIHTGPKILIFSLSQGRDIRKHVKHWNETGMPRSRPKSRAAGCAALKNKALRNVLKLPDMASVQTAAASAAGAQAAVVGKPVDLFDYRPTPRKKSRLSQNPRQQ